MIASNPKDAIGVRPYRSEDLSSLTALFQASVRRIARADYTEAQVKVWAPELIEPEPFGERRAQQLTWVTEVDARTAGFSAVDADGHIDMLYVHPDFARRGVAHALLARIEELARERGLGHLYTQASITARPVFERRGFQVLAEQSVSLRGETFTNFRMEKALDGPGAR